MKRHIITLGAPTTAGGTVLMASAHGSINRKNIALEGDPIFCPVCNSKGKIKCVEPRISETWNERKVALEHDLCICGCAVPPRLVANQCLRYQMIGGTASAGMSSRLADTVSPSGSHAPASSVPNYDLFFVLQDKDTGESLAGVPYKITLESGRVVKGKSDMGGKTQHIYSDQPEMAILEAPYYDEDSAQAYLCNGSDACDC
ncbi:PAAR domain-containing protein [Pseudoduganella danionis]|uniref:PAAR domain-containing protein n=1 Tax=Pseudoduganella danionis TaxID=1890295 RepID=A0ABW9SI08_9BURK|nr:PAAR domain-containing protein [Pseudoduganella danionis]MTW31718.1 hypothetical protein [Pseudoduganella danionis]